MEPGTLTRVLNDFLTTVDGELSLQKGEHFLVYSVIDKHWCYGESRERTGKFPSSHLHKVEVPQLHDSETLFVSTAPFPGEQDGDLSFSQGEIIVGVQDVGSGWYLGHIDSRKGIFPLTHTWKLNSTMLKKPSEKRTIRRKARIKTSLKAQIEGELDLQEGDLVTVDEVLEDGWCHGVTEDGREGTFPEGFISYVDDAVDQPDTSCFARPTSYIGPYNEFPISLSAKSSEDEPAPSYFDLFPDAGKPKSRPTSLEITTNNNNRSDMELKPYAITLYPFNAQFSNELSFGVGEVVHLVKRIDSEWMEGSIENLKGIFPVSYVNIIVDCHEARNDQTLSDLDATATEYNALLPGTVAKVDYTFKAQMDGDLSVVEGDVVTVVEMANEDWVNVKNQANNIGLCPRAYLTSISEESSDLTPNLLEDFVVIRPDKADVERTEEQKSKRLSEPHRPAPPVPAPGRLPLQKQADDNSEAVVENDNRRVEIAGNNNVDLKQKKADQRQNVISELVLTEKEYVRDLKLTYETFNLYNPNFLDSRGIDVTVLFGNILDVIQVAEELLDMILKSMKGREEEVQTIGPCFLKMAEKLQIVYGKYCGNHEAALVLLKKYENNEEIMTVFNKGIETLRHQVACFDMSSVLIKPVQRILKYPLILYELVKCTDDDHPDKQTVEEAWKAMTNVASYINEYKRRKDLVSKYLDNDNTLMRRMAKLNMHSVAKMSTRLSTRLSASLGLTNVTVDPEFEELEKQFRSVEKCTLQLAKDVEQCLVYLSDEAISGEVISDFLIQYYQGIPNVEAKKLRDIRSTIWSQYIKELKVCLERRVSSPINFLVTLLEGPTVLITKRNNKLLDYDAAISRSEKSKDSRIAQEELATAKSNFEALTQQLLEELPILIDAATKVLVNCISAFAHARKLLCGKITKRYLTLCENATHLSTQDILESFLVNHNLLWNQITRFSFAGSNPKIEEGQPKWCPQSDRQRTTLKNKYSNEKLYVVLENIASTSSLDMGAARGTIVAVIKKQDPMGDATRWFVDNGVAQGFLPSQKLQALQQIPQADQSNKAVATNQSVPDLMSMDSPEKETKGKSESHLQDLLYLNIEEDFKRNQNYSNLEQIYQVPQYQNLNYEYYYAEYDFAGNMPGTLSIKKGQALKLVRPHDEKGNDAWWLVMDRHQNSGYVPKNYLTAPPTEKQ